MPADRSSHVGRRSFLASLGVAGLATATSRAWAGNPTRSAADGRLRLAHLTDLHTKDEPGVRRAIRSVLTAVKNAGVDAILNTGDSFMALDKAETPAVESQLRCLSELLAGYDVPMHACLGNHDLWLPSDDLAPSLSTDARLGQGGRAAAMQVLRMPAPYHAVKIGKWHFIFLDSMLGGRYALGAEQLAWLERTLAAVAPGEHACLCSHVPIISVATTMIRVNAVGAEQVTFPLDYQHRDLREIVELLVRYPCVRAALSGHVHYLDTVDYLGVRHFCGGAVAGNWWRGSDAVLDRHFPPAFSFMDFHTDGRVERTVVPYRYTP